ncbi:hypothetical protein P4414_04270 [Bacillus thuringiensis]|nr:hypothetical protein [Bacillus thuringiensis]
MLHDGGRPTTVSEMARGVRNGVNLIRYANDCIDLKNFQESSDNFVVVHYNDQHSSANRYNAITVTDKFNQYFNVIHDLGKSQKVTVSDENIEEVIRLFNTFNRNGSYVLYRVVHTISVKK